MVTNANLLGAGGHILWLGKLGVPPPALLTLAVPRQALLL